MNPQPERKTAMIPKPEIQYVGQFYVHGSEAKKLEPKKERRVPKTMLPLERLRKREKIYLDPVALVSIAVAVVMVVTMALGALRLREDWTEYYATSNYLSYLNRENARLERVYRNSFDLEEIRSKALALGLMPREEAETRSVPLVLPVQEPEESWLDQLRVFWDGLWA